MTTAVCEPVVDAPAVTEPSPFSVVEVRRGSNGRERDYAVYTGEKSPKGRLRCRVIVHEFGRREFFSVSPERVVRVVAASLADLDKRRRA